jgi:hypothetical protein
MVLAYIDMTPVVWRLPFPVDIATDVVTIAHPHGKVTNSDLELAAEVLAIGTLLAIAPEIKWQPLGTLCDNTRENGVKVHLTHRRSAVAWLGVPTSQSSLRPPHHRACPGQGQRHGRYCFAAIESACTLSLPNAYAL